MSSPDRIGILSRERQPGLEAHQLLDIGLNPLSRDLHQSARDLRICRQLTFAPIRRVQQCAVWYGRGNESQQN